MYAASGGDITLQQNASFQCQLIDGATAAAAAQNLSMLPAAAAAAPSTAWQVRLRLELTSPCALVVLTLALIKQDCSTNQEYSGLSDGPWALAVRPLAGSSVPGADQLAVTSFVVDSEPPEIQVRIPAAATYLLSFIHLHDPVTADYKRPRQHNNECIRHHSVLLQQHHAQLPLPAG